MAGAMTTAPALPLKVVLTFIPLAMGLPDVLDNVLLQFCDGTCLPGYLDSAPQPDAPVWRDLTSWPIEPNTVVAWAQLPEGLNDTARQRQLLLAAVLPGQGALP